MSEAEIECGDDCINEMGTKIGNLIEKIPLEDLYTQKFDN